MDFYSIENLSVFVSKTCDIENSFFDKGVVVFGDVNIRGSEICEGGLHIAERSKIFASSISNQKTFKTPFTMVESSIYELSLKSIELAEVKTLSPGRVRDFALQLKGQNKECNYFTFKSDNIYNSNKGLSDILQIFIDIPKGSTAVINIIGQRIVFNSIDIYSNGENIEDSCDINILWNFSECALFSSSFSNLYGVFLVPFGKCRFKKVYIKGKIITKSLNGNLEVFDTKFNSSILFDKKKEIKEIKEEKKQLRVKKVKAHKCDEKPPKKPICDVEDTCGKDDNKVSLNQAYSDIIESIAQEEAGLSNILKSEGLKIEKAIDLACNTDDLIKINSSVKRTLAQVCHNQMLLQYKLSQVSENISNLCNK